MRRLALALLVCLGVAAAGPLGADITPTQTTQVTLSCSDGHSVVLNVDAATLTGLTSDVNAINSSGTGLSCGLDPASTDPSAESADWTVYDYNPSGRAISPRNSPNSMPATTTGSTTSFNFIAGEFTALLTTTDPSLTGDLSTKTLTDTVHWMNTGTFSDQNSGGCLPNKEYVRFYFTAPSASGSSIGTPPAGFYTKFWWSNPSSLQPSQAQLIGDPGGSTMAASLSDTTDWSDWNGKRPSDDPSVMEAFIEATHDVQSVGLSFGGGCFFENGVTTSGGGTFSSAFSD